MGYFKDSKENNNRPVSKSALNKGAKEEIQDQIVNTLDSEDITGTVDSDNNRINEWLDNTAGEGTVDFYLTSGQEDFHKDDNGAEILGELTGENSLSDENSIINENDSEESINNMIDNLDDNVDVELLNVMNLDKKADQEDKKAPVKPKANVSGIEDEVTIISKGTIIHGSITSESSIDIMGEVTGDIESLGKLTIAGRLNGNVSAAEVYVTTERMEGNIVSDGAVKIGLGTVVIGDVSGVSGVVAGAVKGEVDIKGPVVIDSTAIIKGNIKAKSIQINNGAVVDGYCSLSYSDVNVDNVFE